MSDFDISGLSGCLDFVIFLGIVLASWHLITSIIRDQSCFSLGIFGLSWCLILLGLFRHKFGIIRFKSRHQQRPRRLSFGKAGLSQCLLLGCMMPKWCLIRCPNHKLNKSLGFLLSHIFISSYAAESWIYYEKVSLYFYPNSIRKNILISFTLFQSNIQCVPNYILVPLNKCNFHLKRLTNIHC